MSIIFVGQTSVNRCVDFEEITADPKDDNAKSGEVGADFEEDGAHITQLSFVKPNSRYLQVWMREKTIKKLR